MKTIHAPIVLTVILLLSVLLFSCSHPDRSQPDAHHMTVRMLDDEWRVVDAQDSSKFIIRARRGDTISWTAQGSDASFQFPHAALFVDGIIQLTLDDGESVTLTVSPSARKGAYPYAVFIHRDNVYARGQSPPEIIIK
jgi:hypothetical protein